MGNKASRRKGPVADEYTAEDIERKFENMPRLTEMETKVLKASWRPIKLNGTKVGQGTFLELFSAYPDSQFRFSKFRGDDLAALEQSEELLRHGERVIAVLDKVMANVDDKRATWDILIDIGKQHFLNGALPMYMELMGPHFVIAVRNSIGSEWYEALEYHWLAMFDLIYYCMNFGWNLQRAEEQKTARVLDSQGASLIRNIVNRK